MSETKYSRYEDNKRARGYVKIHPWVPEKDRAAIDRYIAKKVKAHEKKRKEAADKA